MIEEIELWWMLGAGSYCHGALFGCSTALEAAHLKEKVVGNDGGSSGTGEVSLNTASGRQIRLQLSTMGRADEAMHLRAAQGQATRRYSSGRCGVSRWWSLKAKAW
jgi:hypothetical protein